MIEQVATCLTARSPASNPKVTRTPVTPVKVNLPPVFPSTRVSPQAELATDLVHKGFTATFLTHCSADITSPRIFREFAPILAICLQAQPFWPKDTILHCAMTLTSRREECGLC